MGRNNVTCYWYKHYFFLKLKKPILDGCTKTRWPCPHMFLVTTPPQKFRYSLQDTSIKAFRLLSECQFKTRSSCPFRIYTDLLRKPNRQGQVTTVGRKNQKQNKTKQKKKKKWSLSHTCVPATYINIDNWKKNICLPFIDRQTAWCRAPKFSIHLSKADALSARLRIHGLYPLQKG